jgi:predicted DNA-binding transcriptional regulator AlpA
LQFNEPVRTRQAGQAIVLGCKKPTAIDQDSPPAHAFKAPLLHLVPSNNVQQCATKGRDVKDMQRDDYLTKAELASMLRVSTRTISNYVQTGAIPGPVKFGRKALWSRAALTVFVQAQLPAA